MRVEDLMLIECIYLKLPASHSLATVPFIARAIRSVDASSGPAAGIQGRLAMWWLHGRGAEAVRGASVLRAKSI
jgi:hypothetical protein